jgi:two-component system sensor histidine kinase KdpD
MTARSYLLAALACLGTALVAWPLTRWIAPANLVMLFLLAVFLVAWRLGRGPALMASVLSVVLFDVFFVPPLFTLSVEDGEYLITFVVMLVVAVLTGHMTAGLREQAQAAGEGERRNHSLYRMARTLAGAYAREQVADTVQEFLGQSMAATTTLWLPDAQDRLCEVARDRGGRSAPGHVSERAVRAYARGEAVANLGATGRGPGALYLPLRAPQRLRGVLEVHADGALLGSERALLETVVSLAGIAVVRLHYVEVAQHTEMAMAAERLRNNVLASLSHDLRTPLTALVGWADTLAEADPPLAPPHDETARGLREQARNLAQLVGDLLDLARIAAGRGFETRKEWQSVEEVVGSALRSLGPAADHVRIELAADLPLVRFDAVLIERALANLVDNVLRHAPTGSSVRVEAHREGTDIVVAVLNTGTVFPPGLVAAPPYAAQAQGGAVSGAMGLRAGAGLGLAIASAVVEAHGGRLTLSNLPDAACARIELPCAEAPPSVAEEAA